MAQPHYEPGDMVFSRVDLQNDGGIPELAGDARLASAGARGVIVRVGHLESQPDINVYLVRFEDAGGVLGLPVGCFGEELTQDQALADALGGD